MTDDLSTAFDLEARAAALAGPDPLDRLSLLGHVVSAEIGAFEQERGVTQRLRFDIVVELRPQGDAGDDVDRILSYDRLSEAVAAELAAERLNLLETLASRVAARLLREPQAERVFLRIQKLDRGPGDLGVEIVRSRAPAPGPDAAPDAALAPPRDAAPDAAAPEAPRPRLVLLAPGADPAPLLEAPPPEAPPADAPLLLCPGPPAAPPPRAATGAAQRRIDLLALDQAAWALASRDPRLLVAASRTELDWALRRGRPCVWAPSRLVLDSPDAPPGADPLDLAAWLAGRLGARSLALRGLAPPPGFRPPVPLDPVPLDPAP